ncbi:uncharacterized protein LOC130429790 isoform X2 [Triplophysa dalaica]|uniref:uncharacterized protein LOC130429790 isoform X2 n=1 Tax=Triplophysa dalaica TaxID=1582913 RepID=UPI0024DF89EE|nr:uncharacterized protein LOC130429790 isoform X2 [Triplophysa dalaica]XP_056614556.1 uncharacterized protein LOC130429790 isoform X2 [Triplophysa dalaica]
MPSFLYPYVRVGDWHAMPLAKFIGLFQSPIGDVKEKTVLENWSSVTLESDVTELQSDDVIEWSFRDKVIYKFSSGSKIFNDEQIFLDRVQMDDQTGSLTITNIRTEDAGLYKVKISSSSRLKSFLQFIISRGPSYSQFSVIVTVSKVENTSVTLNTGVTELQSEDVIQWRFGETLIAQINRRNDTLSTYDAALDGRFRDRLNLDDQTGNLTITDLRPEHTGDYKLRAWASYTVDDVQLNVYVRERKEAVALGGSVTLNMDVAGIQRGDVIRWRFGDEETLIAEMTVGTKPSYVSTDERFRNRLRLNPQTGHLTITNITSELSGVYRAKISSRSRGTEYRTYRVFISVFAYKRESVTLHTKSQMQRESEIKWISQDKTTLVTGINGEYREINYTDDVIFRDRLEMNPQTGDLTITDIRQTDEGLYTLQQISIDGKISYRIFQVWVWGDTLNSEQAEIRNQRK